MRKILIGCAILAGLGTAVPASAQDVQLEIGRDGLRLREACNPRYEDCYYRDDYRYRDNYRAAQRCTEGRALSKAERMGIRRARIEDSGRGTIEVGGRNRHGDRIYVTFGRQPNCPVLS